jgi:hypothetical protein
MIRRRSGGGPIPMMMGEPDSGPAQCHGNGRKARFPSVVFPTDDSRGPPTVIAGLDPAIHLAERRGCPGMTGEGDYPLESAH